MHTHLLIEWKEENELGIPVIDDQHRGIVSVINSLSYFIESKKVDYFLTTAFTMIDSYTKMHFATEEEMLQKAGYPWFDGHKQLHEDLIRESFSIANKSMRLRDPKIYLDFLRSWWMDHINKKDHIYADYVKTHLTSWKV